ncbi:hypothetical protein, partial [Clostridium cuniculi]|uniref:hypothetical protein n=1 Tax=Clostridium cuniculi TaxID=2548455 RepID=UPI001A9B710A
LFEAILRKKIVITNKLGYFKMIKENYYDNIYFVDTIDELIITINSDIKFNQIDNRKFYSNFNDNKIIEQFKKIVHNDIK